MKWRAATAVCVIGLITLAALISNVSDQPTPDYGPVDESSQPVVPAARLAATEREESHECARLRVVDAEGRPVAGVRLWLIANGGVDCSRVDPIAVTNADGQVSLVPARASYIAQSTGYRSEVVRVPNPVEYSIKLSAERVSTLRITDSQGVPYAGVAVTVGRGAGRGGASQGDGLYLGEAARESVWRGRSNSDGVVTISGLRPGRYHVNVKLPGHVPVVDYSWLGGVDLPVTGRALLMEPIKVGILQIVGDDLVHYRTNRAPAKFSGGPIATAAANKAMAELFSEHGNVVVVVYSPAGPSKVEVAVQTRTRSDITHEVELRDFGQSDVQILSVSPGPNQIASGLTVNILNPDGRAVDLPPRSVLLRGRKPSGNYVLSPGVQSYVLPGQYRLHINRHVAFAGEIIQQIDVPDCQSKTVDVQLPRKVRECLLEGQIRKGVPSTGLSAILRVPGYRPYLVSTHENPVRLWLPVNIAGTYELYFDGAWHERGTWIVESGKGPLRYPLAVSEDLK